MSLSETEDEFRGARANSLGITEGSVSTGCHYQEGGGRMGWEKRRGGSGNTTYHKTEYEALSLTQSSPIQSPKPKPVPIPPNAMQKEKGRKKKGCFQLV